MEGLLTKETVSHDLSAVMDDALNVVLAILILLVGVSVANKVNRGIKIPCPQSKLIIEKVA